MKESKEDNTLKGISQEKFCLKIDIDKPLTPAILIDVLKGLERFVDPSSYILTNICGSKIKIESITIGEIREGSVILDLLAFNINDLTECFKEAKNMEAAQILSITVPVALTYIANKIISAYKEINTPSEKTIEISTKGDNSPIILSDNEQLIEQLHKLNPDKKEQINEITKKVESSIDKMEQTSQTKFETAKRAVIEMTHPSGEAAKSISFGESDLLKKGESLPIAITENNIELLPTKYKNSVKDEPKTTRLILNDISIKPVVTNTESENKWTARITQEGYPYEELKFIIEDDNIREMILYLLPKSFNANIEVEQMAKGSETKYLYYVFKGFSEDTKAILKNAGFKNI